MKKFEEMLAVTGSCAQATLASAMVEWNIAENASEAIRKIKASPGEDLAGIKSSVIVGLSSFSNSTGARLEELISESDIEVLQMVTPEEIVLALDAIHATWVRENLTVRHWVEKYFKMELDQYRKTAKLPWYEVKKDLLFISKYLENGKCMWTKYDIFKAFEEYSHKSPDDDLEDIQEKVRSFAPDIVEEIIRYKYELSFHEMLIMYPIIDKFLSRYYDAEEIVEVMLSTII